MLSLRKYIITVVIGAFTLTAVNAEDMSKEKDLYTDHIYYEPHTDLMFPDLPDGVKQF